MADAVLGIITCQFLDGRHLVDYRREPDEHLDAELARVVPSIKNTFARGEGHKYPGAMLRVADFETLLDLARLEEPLPPGSAIVAGGTVH
jgi:hypothetical protein